MYKHVMVDQNNKVISISYLNAVVADAGKVVSASVSVELGDIHDPVANTYSPDNISAVYNTKLSKLGFRNRFTFQEKVAIEEAAVSDAQVRVLLKDQDSATYIDVSRQDTIAGVNMLVGKQLLTAERAESILSTTILPTEIYNGVS